MQNASKIVPWIEIRADKDLIILTQRGTSNVVGAIPYFEAIPPKLISELENSIQISELISKTQNISEALSLKKIWNVLDTYNLLLKNLCPDIWWYEKRSYSKTEFQNAWAGWSTQVTLMKDQHQGWWLEVPGAKASLWSKDLKTLERLLHSPTALEIEFLSKNGFGKENLPQDLQEVSITPDWLWWEAVRFNPRYGSLSKLHPQRIKEQYKPRGTALGPVGNFPQQPLRLSTRGHTNRNPLTAQEIVDLLSPIFAFNGSYETDWYGTTYRLHGASGGGAYEHEAWLWIREASDLRPGLYRFNGETRRLETYSLPTEMEKQWEEESQKAWGQEFALPQIVLSIVADLTLLPQKYDRLPLYLAMVNGGIRLNEVMNFAGKKNYAACAIGSGIMRNLAEIWGGNPLLLTPICEMALAGKTKNS